MFLSIFLRFRKMIPRWRITTESNLNFITDKLFNYPHIISNNAISRKTIHWLRSSVDMSSFQSATSESRVIQNEHIDSFWWKKIYRQLILRLITYNPFWHECRIPSRSSIVNIFEEREKCVSVFILYAKITCCSLSQQKESDQ